MRISDWSSDVCSSDLAAAAARAAPTRHRPPAIRTDAERGRAARARAASAASSRSAFRRPRRSAGRRSLLEILQQRLDLVDIVVGQRVALGEMRSEEHTSELQSLMRISYAVFCLK